jgi:tRNA (guanine-N7-)-methyltransferase
LSVVRVRQHVNPLSQKFQSPVALPDWGAVYTQPDLPLHLDIGCARGRFVHQMAIALPEWNHLGVEIRESLVVEANRLRDEAGLGNLNFLFCNINVMLRDLLASLPVDRLQRVSIQFPDPWFKTRHKKRRVVQPEVVALLAEFMAIGTEVLLQSDVLEVATEMREHFLASPQFTSTTADWLPDNPWPVPTERELATARKGLPVYRVLFNRV